MLTELTIKDVVLITDLHLQFDRGLSALTGETGAGKSILLDSMGLALGQRAETGLIRKGCDKAIVTAHFELPADHGLIYLLQEHELADASEGQHQSIILKRVLSKDGRSKAYINDQPVSVKLLADIGAQLVDIHGQFETHGLMNARRHGKYLDMFGQIQPQKQRVAQLFNTWKAAKDALAEAQNKLHEVEREEQWLRDALADLEKLEPEAGEETTLLERRGAIAHQAAIISSLQNAVHYLDQNGMGGENGMPALPAINEATRVLNRIADKGGAVIEELIGRLDSVHADLSDIHSALQDRLFEVETGGNDLEHIDHKLHGYRVQARKHRCTADDLPAVLDDLRARLAMLDDRDGHLAALQTVAHNAREDYLKEARGLSHMRQEAAASFDAAIMQELPALKLASAEFKTDVIQRDEASWNAEGIDQVAFTVKTNAGSDFAPLDKSASGGELSRIMLALKVVLSAVSPVPVMVFDEVDSGMGGATAAALGDRLAALAQNIQVLAVTHAPQIAARAGAHMVVSKKDIDSHTTETLVTRLADRAARCDEIARMLSGAEITTEARAAAESLMNTAQNLEAA